MRKFLLRAKSRIVRDTWRNLLTSKNLFQSLISKRRYRCLKFIRSLYLWSIKISEFNYKLIMSSSIQLSFSKRNVRITYTLYWFMMVCKLNLGIIIHSYMTEWLKIGWDSMITLWQLRQSKMYLKRLLVGTSIKMANVLILWYMSISKLKMSFKKFHCKNTAKRILWSLKFASLSKSMSWKAI